MSYYEENVAIPVRNPHTSQNQVNRVTQVLQQPLHEHIHGPAQTSSLAQAQLNTLLHRKDPATLVILTFGKLVQIVE